MLKNKLLSAMGGSEPSDPNFSNVRFLLHGDGTNGSQSFYDSSNNHHSISAIGNAQIITSVKKYGTGAMYFDGASKLLAYSAPSLPTLEKENFTVEAWIYPTTVNQTDLYCVAASRGSSGIGWFFGIYQGKAFLYDDVLGIFSGGVVAANIWQHMAYARSGTTHRLFLNGGLVANTTQPAQAHTSTALSVASDDSSSTSVTAPYFGYIDDLRITKGVARYTANFTPPAQAFPNK